MEASPEAPFLALHIELDPGRIGELILAAGPPERPGRPQRGLAVSRAEPPLLDAVGRLMLLLDSPRALRVPAPLVLREIAYRLLVGEHVLPLWQIAAETRHARRRGAGIRGL